MAGVFIFVVLILGSSSLQMPWLVAFSVVGFVFSLGLLIRFSHEVSIADKMMKGATRTGAEFENMQKNPSGHIPF
jgi:hypothetical protein